MPVDPDAVGRLAVVGQDYDLLRHVYEAAGEVAGVRGVEGGVGQTLARAVGGYEVLQDAETLSEVGFDGTVDDTALWSGHQSAHSGHLLDLCDVALGSGVGHEVNAAVVFEVSLNDLGELVVGLGPDVDCVLVSLLLGDESVHVLLFEIVDLVLGSANPLPFLFVPAAVDNFVLLRGHRDVADRDGDSRLGRICEA